MGVKVATGCLNWSQPSISHSSSSSTLSSKRRSFTFTDVSLVCRCVHRSSLFGKKLTRSRSCETLNLSRRPKSIKRIVSANFDSKYSYSWSDIHDFALGYQLSEDDQIEDASEEPDASVSASDQQNFALGKVSNWSGDMISACIERKAKSMDLPVSIRIIQKKKQWDDGFREAGEFAYCSMKKAFSSMVFIIRELQSYTLQMREVLFLEDLQGILIRVQKEMNATFVWMFQQVFSHTPNLMVCVMILLANYSVYSMSNHVRFVAPPVITVETVSTVVTESNTKFDSVNSAGKTASVDGINGGGGKFRPVSSGTDGDGKFRPDGYSSSNVVMTGTDEESGTGQVEEAEEWGLWQSVVAEAEEMRNMAGDGGIDHEIWRMFVSPLTVKIQEEVDAEVYFKTELLYQTGLSKEPDNPLLMANCAQFLYLFSQDHKKAEDYFKKASEMEPKDAEALYKYASFLWHAKNDLWAAEETFLEAISNDPSNTFYRATYADFLWSNGADDTCFPLESPDGV